MLPVRTSLHIPLGVDLGTGVGALLGGCDPAAVEGALREGIRANPGSPVHWRNLGVLAGAQGRWKESLAYLHRASLLAPRDASILADLAVSLMARRRTSEALSVLRRAARMQPKERQIRLRMADALWRSGQSQEALQICRALLAADASYLPALRLQAILRLQAGQYHQALADWTQATACSRTRTEWALLAGLHWHCGNTRECVAIGRQLIDSGPLDPALHSGYVSGRLHTDEETIDGARQAVEEWGRIHRIPPDSPPVFAIRRRRRPRIGYFTQEFPSGPAIHFILPLLEQRSSRFEIYGYHIHPKRDAWSWRAARHCDYWREALDVDSLARLIRDDALDVLVDLSGHYGSALILMQQRHAPVQVTFPNYPGSTGALAVDYILTDRWVCPPGAEQQYTEKPIWLPAGYLPYRPPLTPRLTPPPCLENGYVTFGLLQRPSKWNDACWDAIAEVLHEVPRSRLLVHYSAAELDDPRSECRKRIRRMVEVRGVSPRRLRFRGKASLAEHLSLLSEIDIGLDTFPYAGQTTTSECLWMGVPVISITGRLHVARVGWQILDRVGAGELAAADATEYVGKAIELACHPPRILHYRRNLRRNMRSSALLNGDVVRGVEAAYEGVLPHA